MIEVSFVNSLEQFLEHTQIITLLQDQMHYIGSPKKNEELVKTIKLAFKSDNAYLMVLSDSGHIIGFAFYNVCIGMESAGKYLWLNEMHIHKDYRNQGFGKILYDKLIEWCKENNILRLMGIADEKEDRTISFYRKQGAEITKQQIISYAIEKET